MLTALLIGTTGALGLVVLGVGVIALRYVEDVLEQAFPRQRHPLERDMQSSEATQRTAEKKFLQAA